MKAHITLLALMWTSVLCSAETSVIIKQTNAPLVITNYVARFEANGPQSYAQHPDQITHYIGYTNVSGKDIVAIQVGFVAFDAFNNFMGSSTGWGFEAIAKDGTREDEWPQIPAAAFSFQKYGTSLAYVKAVRFSDGSIWTADIAAVLLEVQKIEKDLTKEDLQEKRK